MRIPNPDIRGTFTEHSSVVFFYLPKARIPTVFGNNPSQIFMKKNSTPLNILYQIVGVVQLDVVLFLIKTHEPFSVQVQPRKTRPDTEKLLTQTFRVKSNKHITNKCRLMPVTEKLTSSIACYTVVSHQ